MADLYIDGGALRRTRSGLARIGELLDQPCRAMGNLPAEAAGVDALRQRLAEFGAEWEYGIGKLGEFSETGVTALDNIEQTFAELDAELAQQLNA